MNAIELEKKVIEIFGHAYRVLDVSTINRDTDIKAQLSNKSLDMVGFVAMVEKELDVEIPLSQATKIKTVGEMIDTIAQQL